MNQSNTLVTEERSKETATKEAIDEQKRETIKIQNSPIKAPKRGKKAASML